MFRKAILGTGTQYTRVSVRGMMQGVVTSSSGQSDGLRLWCSSKSPSRFGGKRCSIQSGAFSVTSPIGKFLIITKHSKIRSFRHMVTNEAFGRNMRSKNEPTILSAENTTP